MQTDGRTNMTKLTAALRNLATATKNASSTLQHTISHVFLYYLIVKLHKFSVIVLVLGALP